MSDEILAAQDQTSLRQTMAVMDAGASDSVSNGPGPSSGGVSTHMRERVRRVVAAFGGASRLARLLTEVSEKPIGESGVRAWSVQGAIPLRRRLQLAQIGRSLGLVVDIDTLDFCFAPVAGDKCDPLDADPPYSCSAALMPC
jgi:hypothetical protein